MGAESLLCRAKAVLEVTIAMPHSDLNLGATEL